ncbi:MAG: DUF924 family protein [Methylovirgula sp.]
MSSPIRQSLLSEALSRSLPCGGDEGAYRASLEHLDIVARFGRFPHRNAALGLTATAEEQAFLDAGGFAM